MLEKSAQSIILNNLLGTYQIHSGQNQQKITVDEFIFSVVSGCIAWNRTKNKLLHSDFLLILPTGMWRFKTAQRNLMAGSMTGSTPNKYYSL